MSDIKASNIFIKNKKGEILNLENNPSSDKFTNILLELIFDEFGSRGTRIFLTSRTKSIVEYFPNESFETKRVKAMLAFSSDWDLEVSPF